MLHRRQGRRSVGGEPEECKRSKNSLGQAHRGSYAPAGMSKNFSLTAVLVALLLLVTALFGAFALTHARVQAATRMFQSYERGLETQLVLITRNRSVFQAMVNDAREYAKRSPAMASLLQQFTPSFEQINPTNKPATPPPPRTPTP